jgi:hypothetical protein
LTEPSRVDNEDTNEGGNPSGGCSAGCASFFVLLVVVWPLLHGLGGTYEPDILLFPILLGVPAFIITHILAIIASFSKSEATRRWGKRALWILWGGIAVFLLLGLVAYGIDLVRGKGDRSNLDKRPGRNYPPVVKGWPTKLPEPLGAREHRIRQ